MWASCAFWSLFWAFVLLFRGYVTPARFHHQAALRLLEPVRQINLQVTNSPVALLVGRDEGETVTRAEVSNEGIKRVIELFRLITQDLSARFVCQVLNVDIWSMGEPAKTRGPTHHAVLRYLFRRLRNYGGDNATRLKDGMRDRFV